MRIVNTFISDDKKIPEYTICCLHRLRELNLELPIDFIASDFTPYQAIFRALNINMINQKDVQSTMVDYFNKISWFTKWGTPNTKYPSPELFFHRASERIFYLCDYIQANNYEDIFHCENDVVCYYPIKDVEQYFHSQTISITPASHKTYTMAICHIPNLRSINNICDSFIENMSLGEDYLLKHMGVDMINEMSMLYLCRTEGLVNDLPISPEENTKFVFDPSSYGQYLGGTNNFGNEIGFTDMLHILGPRIRSGDYKVEFKNHKPYVNNKPIFNLHVHSKNLGEFL